MPSKLNGRGYHRNSVTTSGRSLSRIAAIDQEIRDVLAEAEPALQPFYGMMLYHLGLDMDRPGGGKRMRPLMCVLVYEALAGEPQAMLPAAAALELLHNFTLIHDDIEDHEPTRHHRPTVWSVWGVPQAINTGDGMYAASRLAVQRLRERSFPADRILDFACLIDRACVRVCEGQFLDITFEDRTDITVERYRAMAAKKTGALIAACAEGAAGLATEDPLVRDALARFGDDFGQAFQAYDDLQGISATTERTGKLEMNDLVKRKKTLPVVIAFEKASPRLRTELAALFEPPAPLAADSVERIREILDELGTREQLEAEIASHRTRALHALRAITAVTGEPPGLLEQLIAAATRAEGPAGGVSR